MHAGSVAVDGDDQRRGAGSIGEFDEWNHQPPARRLDGGGLDFDPQEPVGSLPDSGLRSPLAAVVEAPVGLFGPTTVGADEAGGVARLVPASLAHEES